MENKIIDGKSIILVADFDRWLVAEIKQDLEGAGCEVITSTDGPEALAVLRKERVDVLVLGIVLSISNGWEVFEIIHREAIMPLQKVVFIVGIAQDGTTPRVMRLLDVPFAYWEPPTWMMPESLPDDFDWTHVGILMVKPFTMSSLRRAVMQVLKST